MTTPSPPPTEIVKKGIEREALLHLTWSGHESERETCGRRDG